MLRQNLKVTVGLLAGYTDCILQRTMPHLHNTSWVNTNHYANPTESRVFLFVVTNVP